MAKFIKLTNIIINTTKIITIDILPTKYNIIMSTQHFDVTLILGSGGMQTITNNIEICKNKHPNDYQTIEIWIKQIKNSI